jgi:hypothetical protein
MAAAAVVVKQQRKEADRPPREDGIKSPQIDGVKPPPPQPFVAVRRRSLLLLHRSRRRLLKARRWEELDCNHANVVMRHGDSSTAAGQQRISSGGERRGFWEDDKNDAENGKDGDNDEEGNDDDNSNDWKGNGNGGRDNDVWARRQQSRRETREETSANEQAPWRPAVEWWGETGDGEGGISGASLWTREAAPTPATAAAPPGSSGGHPCQRPCPWYTTRTANSIPMPGPFLSGSSRHSKSSSLD